MAFLLQKWGDFSLFYMFYSKNLGLPGCFSSLQVFNILNGKIQIVHFIPSSFNLYGIVQFINSLTYNKKRLHFNPEHVIL